ncbi:NAD(P)-dependent oxidoreductase, partial [Candidatus Pacearchaeota archaeon CG_4_9_14_3_um_filter_30_11]
MKIAIFGSLGFLGTKLKNVFLKSGHQILGIDNNESSEFKIDATNFEQVSSFLEKERPDLIIDTIGLTSSLECEKYPNKAILLNYKTAKNISQASKKINIPLIFISSSYVFDGKKGNYSEEDKPSPLNEYGKTKVL